MGTNYYAEVKRKEPCECCGMSGGTERLHIGKSSGGWCFALHVIPEKGIKNLEDWLGILSSPEVTIHNEYGAKVNLQELVTTIAERGENPRRSTYCVGHGPGSWDYMEGEFS